MGGDERARIMLPHQRNRRHRIGRDRMRWEDVVNPRVCASAGETGPRGTLKISGLYAHPAVLIDPGIEGVVGRVESGCLPVRARKRVNQGVGGEGHKGMERV
jgi:hypothetical protein